MQGAYQTIGFEEGSPAKHDSISISDSDISARLNMDAPGMEHIKEAFQSGDLKQLKLEYLNYRRNGCPTRWRISPSDKPKKPIAKKDAEGDLVCAHLIPCEEKDDPIAVLQAKHADMGRDFNWQYNPTPRSDLNFTNEFTFVFVSRTPFWRELADAYWKTGDEKYAKEWVRQMEDFAQKNPMPPGKNGMFSDNPNEPPSLWLALDSAIRMKSSWPYAYAHFANSPAFTPDAEWLYLKLVYQHAMRLLIALSDESRSGNHISSESRGLYVIGVLFPEFKEAAEWRNIAMTRLTKEMNRMVPADGFEAELTPGYHLVALNDFRSTYELCRLNHLPEPDGFKARLLAMYCALVQVMDQSGFVVPTNDSWPLNAAKQAKEGLQLGEDALLQWAASSGREGEPPPLSTFLPNAGFYAMRSGWKKDDTFLFFRGGPAGIAHEHADKLEIVLRAFNKTLLFDPGVYSYDVSDWRRFSIGTESHNTILVDGKWQRIEHTQMPIAQVKNPWVTTPLLDFVAATFSDGYQDTVHDPHKEYHPFAWVGDVDKSVTHTRRVLFMKPSYALVLDTVDGAGQHEIEARFNIDAPAARLDAKTQSVRSLRKDGVQIALFPLERDGLRTKIVQGQTEPLLGWMPVEHRPIPTACFTKKQEMPATIATLAYPYKGKAPDCEASEIKTENDALWARTVQLPTEKAEIIIAKNSQPTQISFESKLLGAVKLKAAGMVCRKYNSKRAADVCAWSLQSYHSDRLEFSTDANADLNFSQNKDALRFYNASDKPIKITITIPSKQNLALAPLSWTVMPTSEN